LSQIKGVVGLWRLIEGVKGEESLSAAVSYEAERVELSARNLAGSFLCTGSLFMKQTYRVFWVSACS